MRQRLRRWFRMALDALGFQTENTRFRDVDDLAERRRHNEEQARLARLRRTMQHGT